MLAFWLNRHRWVLASLAVSQTTSEHCDRHICISINRKTHTQKGSDEAQWLKILTGNQKIVDLNLTFFKVNMKSTLVLCITLLLLWTLNFTQPLKLTSSSPLIFSPSPINSLPYKDFLWSNQSLLHKIQFEWVADTFMLTLRPLCCF